MQAAIYGLEGLQLNDGERSFFRDADPAGFIIFRRNCETPEQLLRLTDSLRDLTGRPDLPHSSAKALCTIWRRASPIRWRQCLCRAWSAQRCLE